MKKAGYMRGKKEDLRWLLGMQINKGISSSLNIPE